MPEVILKQLEARINKLSLEVKEARTERTIALITSQKDKAIGQVIGKLAQCVLFR